MNKGAAWGLILLMLAVAGGGGYWIGQRNAADTGAQTANASGERKPLYYRNPMGLPDTSPVPKKDPMGMDYIPVFAGDQTDEPAAANQIKIATDKVQKLGVRTEAAQLRTLDKIVRAAGRVEPDERRIYTISPKFEGYVERLHVNATGHPVGKGQALFDVYSPELVSAQREYQIAVQGMESLKEANGQARSGMQQLAESSLLRLKNWDISEEQIKALAKSGETRRTLTFRSPVSGIVTEKKALQGMRFMPGEALYQVADLSAVWVVADVFEQDIAAVAPGTKANIRINAYPDKVFEGRVAYVYPTLSSATRTTPVRIELPNPGLLLKPAMFAQVELPVASKGEVVTVPLSAVIDSGTRQIVLIQAGEGRFEPRDVKLGSRSEHHVEIREGIQAGEQVVVAANFLIDAESNLKAAVGGFGHAGHGAAPGAQGETKTKTVSHRAEGQVESVDAKAGTVSISHGPVATLNWPAMTMEFKVANTALQSSLSPSTRVSFEFVE
ncbi:MAG TPA: efflux RND transporter periplasmic adaptor subunit, partial [Rhodocyclaceae bacterium]|nr:efflux RND transporter periplasmic adaptor subunit [Rhodocyclaceae bacterium]